MSFCERFDTSSDLLFYIERFWATDKFAWPLNVRPTVPLSAYAPAITLLFSNPYPPGIAGCPCPGIVPL